MAIFLDHDGLAHVTRLRRDGKLSQAEKILYGAEPSPAVLDELRKVAYERAKMAKNEKDWPAVIQALEGYQQYAEQNRAECIRMVNAEPPSLN